MSTAIETTRLCFNASRDFAIKDLSLKVPPGALYRTIGTPWSPGEWWLCDLIRDQGREKFARLRKASALSSGAELVLLSGDKRHWVGLLYHRATRTTCGVSVGFPAPDGWLDGTPFRGR